MMGSHLGLKPTHCSLLWQYITCTVSYTTVHSLRGNTPAGEEVPCLPMQCSLAFGPRCMSEQGLTIDSGMCEIVGQHKL